MDLAKFPSSLGWGGVLLRRRHGWSGSGEGCVGGDGVGGEARCRHQETCCLAPGTGLLGCAAQWAREGEQMVIVGQM